MRILEGTLRAEHMKDKRQRLKSKSFELSLVPIRISPGSTYPHFWPGPTAFRFKLCFLDSFWVSQENSQLASYALIFIVTWSLSHKEETCTYSMTIIGPQTSECDWVSTGLYMKTQSNVDMEWETLGSPLKFWIFNVGDCPVAFFAK